MDAAIRKAKDSFGQIFDKNLHDLVRGIRNHKENEAKYISECIDEIKQELKQDNIAVKANAINKLCYLQMLGYDISWAAFNMIEVMSSTKFTFKRIGYLTASQSFHEGTDVLMLTTNMIRKDLGSQNMYECGTALAGLSCFLTPDLARDLSNEIMTLMTSNKPYIRKKAVLIMYKIFLKYPDALRPSFPRLKEKLDDPEPSVQAAAVNVICELARKNPKNYLSLAPIFFKLMTVSTNNWVLIKIIKLFGALTPLEPRLGKKLIEPLTNLINSTSAMSLLYECINTVLAVLVSISSGQPNHNSAIEICLQKLRILIEDSDQNLKYLGLLAMSKILQTNPKSVQAHKDLIMQCLDDKDESIRLRSLDLLYGMVSKKNLMEIIKKLMVHMSKAEGSHYRDELLAKIIDICSQNNYQYVTNFEWYVSVLVELTRMEGTRHGKLLSSQMLDVAIRVESIRPFIVQQMAILIDNIHVFTNNTNNNGKENKNSSDICEVLNAATWICGEFAIHLTEPSKTLEAMLKSKVTSLPGHIQSTFVQNIFKLYSHLITRIYKQEDGIEQCKQLTNYLNDKMIQFKQSADIEVQERACNLLQILKYVEKMFDKQLDGDAESGFDIELAALFEGELNPVAPKAQRKVPVPDGLDLDAWINEPPSESEDETISSSDSHIFIKNENQKQQQNFTSLSSSNYGGNYSSSDSKTINVGAKISQPDVTEEELIKYKQSRKIQIDSNPFYIKSAPNVKKSESNSLMSNSMSKSSSISDQIRSQSIDLKIPINIPGVTSSDSYYRMSKIDDENKKLKKKMKNKLAAKNSENGKKKKDKNDVNEYDDEDDDESTGNNVKILANEMPEGAVDDSDEDKFKNDPNDPHRALDINLDEPLKENEKLPIPTHRSINFNEQSANKKSDKLNGTNGLKELSDDKKEKKKSKTTTKSKKNELVNEEKSSKREKKSSSNTSKKLNKSKNESIDLLVSNDIGERDENDYNELLSPEHEVNTIVEKLDSNFKIEQINNQEDDLDFWLSSSKSQTEIVPSQVNEQKNVNEEKVSEKKMKKSKKSNGKHDESEEKEKKEKKSSKKSSKSNEEEKLDEKAEKKSKKEKKTTKKENSNGHLSNNSQVDLKHTFRPLVSNKQLKITHLIRPNLMNLNQIIINLNLTNITSDNSEINSIELNILDTASLKLARDDSKQANETVKIQFSLKFNTHNQVELLFNVSDCTFPQNLKGNFSYMIKTDSGSLHEKIDFKLNVPCSSYLIQTSCDNDDFSKWLSNGQLTFKYSVKCNQLNYDVVNSVISKLATNFNFSIIEIVDNNASLFASSIQHHPVCFLIKYLNDQSLTIDAKSTNRSLIENILEEFKLFLTA